MDNKPRLKDRLARFFRPPALLRASAAVKSNRSLSAGESTRSFSAAGDIAHEPIFISRSRASEADELHFALLRRSFSLDRRPRRDLCGGCRPAAAALPAVDGKEKRENRKSGRSAFYETGEHGEGDGKTCPPASPSFESPNSAHLYYYWIKEAESKNKRKKKKMMKMKQRQRSRSNRYELSISSSFAEEGFGFFSSEETDTFFSSRSFSSDSSEFYRRPSPKSRKSSKKTEQSNKKKQDENSKFSNRRRRPAAVRRRDNFINGFQPLVSVSFSEENEAENTRREGFPVLKISSDPYSDFRSSMAEMIVERQIFGARELERLLHSYLSLNSPELHSAIFRAFADISQVLFSY